MKRKDGEALVRSLVEARRRRKLKGRADTIEGPLPPAFRRRGAQIIQFKDYQRRRAR